ncbi:MAG: hypothetical protein WBV69_21950 [Candidatus Sulfotelmatobacter sp.]
MNWRGNNAVGHMTLRISRAAVAALCIGVLSAGKAVAQETFERKAWLQDYSALKRALERSYSNLAWFASPQGGVGLPALDRRTLAALHHAKSDEDARSALLAFVAGFHDGHFSQLTSLAPAPAIKIKDPAPFPYDRQKPEAGCAALGYAANGHTEFSLPFESLPGFALIADGQEQPFRAGLLTTDGHLRIGIARIYSFRTEPYFAVCLKAWKGDVWDEHGQLRMSVLKSNIDEEWYRALAGVLKKFEAAKVNAVLVDVGNNSGGNDSGDMVASLLSAMPMHSAKLRMSQDTVASKAYFDEEFAELTRAETYHPDDASQHLIDEVTRVCAQSRRSLPRRVPWNGSGKSARIGRVAGASAWSTRDRQADRWIISSPALSKMYESRNGFTGPRSTSSFGEPGQGRLMCSRIIELIHLPRCLRRYCRTTMRPGSSGRKPVEMDVAS